MHQSVASAFVFSLHRHFLNQKFQASSHLLWLNSPVCVGPEDRFCRDVANCISRAGCVRSPVIRTGFLVNQGVQRRMVCHFFVFF